MIIYLDTSSLFKLYHNEQGTEELDKLFTEENITEIILSAISKVELTSTVWKKIRMNELNINQGVELIELFKADNKNYTFIELDNELIESATKLINEYGKFGLRSLDSIQLATALKYKDKIDIGKTSDKILNDLLIKIGIKTH
jgi:uncharacterized protein